jgi:hypothetical protein
MPRKSLTRKSLKRVPFAMHHYMAQAGLQNPDGRASAISPDAGAGLRYTSFYKISPASAEGRQH